MEITGLVLAKLLIAHVIGDYVIQSSWMANEKTKSWWPAIAHGLAYTLPFIFITQSTMALLIIGGTHIILDHYRIAKYICYAKDFISPKKYWPTYNATVNNGYSPETPVHMSSWLMIIVDNVMHFIINLIAVYILG